MKYPSSIFTDPNYRHAADRDPNPSLVIDMALANAARRTANAQLDPLPALAHQLHILKQGSGRSYTQSKKPRHEAIVCQRCEVVDVVIGRLATFPTEVTLACGHRVVVSAGPALVLAAALLRTARAEPARAALRRTLLPSRDDHIFMDRARYLNPQEAPGWRPPAPRSTRPPSAEPENIFLRGRDYRPTPPALGGTTPDIAQKPLAKPVASKPSSPVSGDGDTETPLASPAVQPSPTPTLN